MPQHISYASVFHMRSIISLAEGKFNCKSSEILKISELLLVREKGLEPSRQTTHAPQTCLSTNSSTLADRARVIIVRRAGFVNRLFAGKFTEFKIVKF